MVSLHQNPSQLVITSMVDFKVLRKIRMVADAMEIAVHPDKHRVFLSVCLNHKKKYDLIEVELGFQKYENDFDTLSMRDQSLNMIMNDNKDRTYVHEMLRIMTSDGKRGTINILQSINILLCYSTASDFVFFDKMTEYDMEMIRDVNGTTVGNSMFNSKDKVGVR